MSDVAGPQAIEAHSRASSRRVWNLEPRELAMLAGILAGSAIIYMPSLRNGWVWDDNAEIVDNTALESWRGIGRSFIHDSWWFRDPQHLPQSAYYRPLEDAWFGINRMILGVHPVAWHLEKIAIELIAVTIAFRLAQLLTRNTTIALVTAGIFALLPANAESVVWVSSIPEPLTGIFEMGALCCFIERKPGRGLSRGMVFALMLYAGALLSHETAILFWLIVGAYLFLIERKSIGVSMRLAAPFMLLAVAYLIARLNALGTSYFIGHPHSTPMAVALGWAKMPAAHGPLDVIMTAPVVLLYYLGVLAVPAMAGPTHDVGWITGMSAITFLAAAVIAMLAVIVLALIGRSPDKRLYLFCAAWSLIAIAPSMSLRELTVLVQDRLLYVPAFGWSLALGIVAVRLADASPRARNAVAGAFAVWLLACTLAVVRLERYWHDDVTYFSRCVAIAPHNAEYLRQLVDKLNDRGYLTAAMERLRNAIKLEPDNCKLHQKLADQYALMQRGDDFREESLKVHALATKERALGNQAR